MCVEPALKNTGLEDVIGGPVSYYDSKVSLIKLLLFLNLFFSEFISLNLIRYEDKPIGLI